MKDIKIIVATHKKYKMPSEDIYFPVHVGADGKEPIGFIPDNTGENISAKNPFYCELTGLYWAWKNLDADYVGLCHYRRHFTCVRRSPKTEEGRFEALLDRESLERLLDVTDVVLPHKRNYFIENLYDHYRHTTYIEPLDETREILKGKYPEYLAEFDKLHTRKKAHMFNMFIMRRDYFNNYCEWLFDILFELEKRVPPVNYDAFHARYPGRISELMLDVWLNTNAVSYREIRFLDMQKVNWLKKGTAFLKAKFISKKYDASF